MFEIASSPTGTDQRTEGRMQQSCVKEVSASSSCSGLSDVASPASPVPDRLKQLSNTEPFFLGSARAIQHRHRHIPTLLVGDALGISKALQRDNVLLHFTLSCDSSIDP